MPPTILLVENDASLVYLIGRYVEQGGYAFAHAPDVPAACAMVGQLRPRLVMLNRLLATLADRGALAALQAALAAHDTPIAGYSQAVLDAGTCLLDIDLNLALPLLYDDFRAALSALGIKQHAADEPTA